MPKAKALQKFMLPSQREGEPPYTVSLFDGDVLKCNCPHWIFNRSGDRTCLHTRGVRVMLNPAAPLPAPVPAAVIEAARGRVFRD